MERRPERFEEGVERGRARRWAPLLAACLAVWTACAEPDAGRRVLVLGVDGATFEVAEPLMRAGRLPHLAELARRGTSGPLRSHQPLLSPRVWTSVATGLRPERHGVLHWVGRDEGSGRTFVYQNTHRRVHALWNLASDAGLTVATVNWLMTFPPDRISGVVVTDHAFIAATERSSFEDSTSENRFGRSVDDRGVRAAPVVFPPEWEEALGPALRAGEPLVGPDPFAADPELAKIAPVDELSRFLSTDQRVVRTALAIDERLRPDLMMVLVQGVDRVSHHLFATVRPEWSPAIPEQAREAGARAMHRTYEITDALIGLLLARYDDDDLVIVVSDHGFEPAPGWLWPGAGLHAGPRSEEGVLFARGRGVPAGRRVTGTSVDDVAPTVLAWLGLPLAEDLDGRVAAFLDAPAPVRVASYETKPVERVTAEGSGREESLLEQLEALGYIE